MSPKQPLQALPAERHQANGSSERVPGTKEFTFKGPLFKTDESAAYLNYRGPHALRSLYRFLKAKGVPTARRFRTVLIKKADLDRAIGLTQRRSA